MGLKIMGLNEAKLNFMFENFPLTTIIKLIWILSPINPHFDSKEVEIGLKIIGFKWSLVGLLPPLHFKSCRVIMLLHHNFDCDIAFFV